MRAATAPPSRLHCADNDDDGDVQQQHVCTRTPSPCFPPPQSPEVMDEVDTVRVRAFAALQASRAALDYAAAVHASAEEAVRHAKRAFAVACGRCPDEDPDCDSGGSGGGPSIAERAPKRPACLSILPATAAAATATVATVTPAVYDDDDDDEPEVPLVPRVTTTARPGAVLHSACIFCVGEVKTCAAGEPTLLTLECSMPDTPHRAHVQCLRRWFEVVRARGGPVRRPCPQCTRPVTRPLPDPDAVEVAEARAAAAVCHESRSALKCDALSDRSNGFCAEHDPDGAVQRDVLARVQFEQRRAVRVAKRARRAERTARATASPALGGSGADGDDGDVIILEDSDDEEGEVPTEDAKECAVDGCHEDVTASHKLFCVHHSRCSQLFNDDGSTRANGARTKGLWCGRRAVDTTPDDADAVCALHLQRRACYVPDCPNLERVARRAFCANHAFKCCVRGCLNRTERARSKCRECSRTRRRRFW